MMHMELTPLTHKAISASARLHRDQSRKSDGSPYVIHPFSVAVLISEHTDDDVVIAAALLHDILEDVPGYSEEDMRRDFGDRVTDIVLEVSEEKDPNVEEDKKATWRERKRKYLAHLEKDSAAALLVAAGDKLHNLTTFNEDLEEQGVSLLARFNAGLDEQVWFYGEMVRILQDRLDNALTDALAVQYEMLKRNIKKL